jgi:hypothetical protein
MIFGTLNEFLEKISEKNQKLVNSGGPKSTKGHGGLQAHASR